MITYRRERRIGVGICQRIACGATDKRMDVRSGRSGMSGLDCYGMATQTSDASMGL